MKIFLTLFQIELKQILRNKIFLASIILVPFLMLLIFSFNPGEFLLKNIKVVFYNSDPSPLSNLFIKFVSSFFKGENFKLITDSQEMERKLIHGKIDGVIIIPKGFASAIRNEKKIDLEYIPSVKNLHTSIYIYRVLKSILEEFSYVVFVRNPNVMKEFVQNPKYPMPGLKVVGISEENFNYPALMLPGLSSLFVLLTIMIGIGTTITKEKERRTLDVLIMSSVSCKDIIISKIAVYTTIGIIETILLLVGGSFLFGVRIQNMASVLFLMILGILSYAGIGIFVSLLSKSSDVSLTIIAGLTFLMIIGSGVFFPVENMPVFFKNLVSFIPMTHVVTALRKIVILGYSMKKIIYHILYTGIFSILLLIVNILIFKLKYEMNIR